MRTSRWTPISAFKYPYAYFPCTSIVALLIPAPSPSSISARNIFNPWRSHHLEYIRRSISAQSCASVPPAPEWMVKNAFFSSSGPLNIFLSSRFSMPTRSFSISRLTSSSKPVSCASSANSINDFVSLQRTSSSFHASTHSFRVLICWMIFCAAILSFQNPSDAVRAWNSFSSCSFLSRSKIPPKCVNTFSLFFQIRP